MKTVTPQDAKAAIHAGGEIALLDVREAGQFGEEHPLFAIPAPYSRLELIIGQLVPRRDAPVLVIDAGDGVAERAAGRLEEAGYSDVSVIAGGVQGWQAAGLGLFKGVNVPSKTLGELAETLWHPQMIRAGELHELARSGKDFAFFDTRPPQEYAKMRVPGAQCLPNGELPHRLAALPEGKPIVVTCAGRTRGIVGAIGMALVGAGDRVRALENGTQGWALAGFDLERDNTPAPLPALDDTALSASRARAKDLIARYGFPTADAAEVARMRGEAGRTTYVLDLRSEAEVADDPIAAATPAPGVQLVQATDQWIAVRRSRVVLCCDTGLRSAIAAFWLRQLGYEPVIAPVDDALRALPAPDLPQPHLPDTPEIIPAARALKRLREGARLIDLRPSQRYRAGHLAGAIWAIRPRLAALAQRIGGREALLIADTPEIARLASRDLREAGVKRIALVEGGQPALERAGAAVEPNPREPAPDEAIDFLRFVHDRHDGNLEAARRYLEWETGLLSQLDAQERAEFLLIGPKDSATG
ncbi:rhodanese-like domain-containing protein [Alkalilacustris brevis]|uniref:rhodanese-like domain-containing protein n=1 Tax=Alkalilacustris brevis TaxID=2026338 RepID=UPI000E0DE190|nr:rhodanese-like domain-containing protein [Alkalilacustris brevis]